MTEDVLVSVKGLHVTEEAEQNEIETISAGRYYNRNGKHYILYEEAIEGTQELVQSCIKLQNGRMEVRKKGPLQSQMIFERDKKNTSWYYTPYGNMMAGIEVTEMKVSETKDLIEVNVDYSLEMNYEHMADCSIQVKVMAKDSGLFHLQT
ncbi:MAG: DUF1934 domain-containing protein [Lachnospiraceae bacterium]|nr:DUF1934 domain-containing protein [Lachnospiraceae bacterium]